MADLWHVALRSRLPEILQHGLKTGLPGSEVSILVEAWQEQSGKDIASKEGYADFCEWREFAEYDSAEVARDKLDELLPRHRDSIFFWANEVKAEQAQKMMRENTHRDYVIIGVDSAEIPGRCVVGDNILADDIYDEIHEFYHDGTWSEEEEWAMEDRVKEMAEQYKEDMGPFVGQEESRLEVMCPVDVPKNAIVSIDGHPVWLHPEQRTIREFKSRGRRGWPKEPRRHALASKGITTRRRRHV